MNCLLILLFSIIFCLGGCASTTLTTIKRPESIPMELKKFLVIAPFSDTDFRRQTEHGFVNRFSLADVKAIPGMNLIPPIKKYSEQELLEILKDVAIDALLVVALKDYWTSQRYISGSTVCIFANSLSYQTYIQENCGYYVSEPQVKFDIRLFDVKSEKLIWSATSITKGKAFADYNTLINSLAKEVLKKLKKEGIV